MTEDCLLTRAVLTMMKAYCVTAQEVFTMITNPSVDEYKLSVPPFCLGRD